MTQQAPLEDTFRKGDQPRRPVIVDEGDRRVFLRRAKRIEQEESEQMKLRGIDLKLRVIRHTGLDHPAALPHAIRGSLLAITTRVAVAVGMFGLRARHRLPESEGAVVRDHQPGKQHHRDHQVAAE